jgi:hypothetical protein
MSVQIEIQNDTATRLAMHAKANDITVDAWLRNVLDEIEKNGDVENDLSPEEFERDMDLLAEGSEHLPQLPPEANSRAFYYDEGD